MWFVSVMGHRQHNEILRDSLMYVSIDVCYLRCLFSSEKPGKGATALLNSSGVAIGFSLPKIYENCCFLCMLAVVFDRTQNDS